MLFLSGTTGLVDLAVAAHLTIPVVSVATSAQVPRAPADGSFTLKCRPARPFGQTHFSLGFRHRWTETGTLGLLHGGGSTLPPPCPGGCWVGVLESRGPRRANESAAKTVTGCARAPAKRIVRQHHCVCGHGRSASVGYKRAASPLRGCQPTCPIAVNVHLHCTCEEGGKRLRFQRFDPTQALNEPRAIKLSVL